jgi:hypothetical protein
MPWIDELPALARGRSLGLTPGMARGRSLSITSGIAPNFDHISDISDIGVSSFLKFLDSINFFELVQIPIMTKIGSMISGSSTLDAESHSTLPPPEIKSSLSHTSLITCLTPNLHSDIGPAYAEYSAYTESLQRQEHVNAGKILSMCYVPKRIALSKGTYITPTLMIDTSFITEQSKSLTFFRTRNLTIKTGIDPSLLSQY